MKHKKHLEIFRKQKQRTIQTVVKNAHIYLPNMCTECILMSFIQPKICVVNLK